jgi:hypothetical protein
MSNSRPFDKGILETFLKNSYVVVGFIDEIGKATSVMRHLCGRSMHAPGVEEMQEVCTDVKRCLASARENAKKATVRELCPRPWIGDHKLCSMLQRGVCVRVLEVCQEDLSRMKNVKDRMEKEHGANDRTLEYVGVWRCLDVWMFGVCLFDASLAMSCGFDVQSVYHALQPLGHKVRKCAERASTDEGKEEMRRYALVSPPPPLSLPA